MTGPAFTASLPLTVGSSSFAACQSLTRPRPAALTPPRTTRAPRMAFSSIERVLTSDPVTTDEDASVVVSAIYKQVLGNAYLMQSERDELALAESQFIYTKDVREFVRAIAKSNTYRSRFFDHVSQYRFIELAFKHLLGSAPVSKAEYAVAMAKYHQHGYDACIDWFVDSADYENDFGNFIVPYGIYKGCYKTNELFNRSVAMRYTPSSSDKGRSTLLQYCVLSGDSPSWLSISKALPSRTERGTGYDISSSNISVPINPNAPPRRIGTKIPGGVVFSQ